MNGIEYKYGNDLNLDEVINLYEASTLGERKAYEENTDF